MDECQHKSSSPSNHPDWYPRLSPVLGSGFDLDSSPRRCDYPECSNTSIVCPIMCLSCKGARYCSVNCRTSHAKIHTAPLSASPCVRTKFAWGDCLRFQTLDDGELTPATLSPSPVVYRHHFIFSGRIRGFSHKLSTPQLKKIMQSNNQATGADETLDEFLMFWITERFLQSNFSSHLLFYQEQDTSNDVATVMGPPSSVYCVVCSRKENRRTLLWLCPKCGLATTCIQCAPLVHTNSICHTVSSYLAIALAQRLQLKTN